MRDTKEYLGRRIQELRKHKGLKQSELAELLGIDSKHMSKLECGRGYPSFELLDRIAFALETTPSDILDTSHLCSKEELIERIDKLLWQASAEKIQGLYKIIKEIL